VVAGGTRVEVAVGWGGEKREGKASERGGKGRGKLPLVLPAPTVCGDNIENVTTVFV
jgi:hypothetical protein